jgi:murein DD-endopeptidase MepM/ murein hydrolase activator NlpD
LAENSNLKNLQARQSGVVRTLQKKEKELRAELDRRKKAIDELDKLIDDLVKAELAKKQTMMAAKENDELTQLFQKQQTKLPWPVNTGFISSPFGRQPHPVLKGIEIDNRGIDIQTSKGSPVKAVFDGQVASVAFVPGMNNVVLIRHGDFYTLYAKINKVKVKKGDVVTRDMVIAEVATDPQGISEIQFQLWKKSDKQDPAKWLVQK